MFVNHECREIDKTEGKHVAVRKVLILRPWIVLNYYKVL